MSVEEFNILVVAAEIQSWDLNDAERAHQAEDALYVRVLTAIAEGNRDPRGLARAALASQQLGFSRWCA